MASDPAIIADNHRLGILDIVSSTLDFGFMGCCKNGDIGPKHHSIANRDKPTVQNREVEVGIEAVTQADVATIVDGERRLDKYLIALDFADNLSEHVQTILLQRVEIRLGIRGEVRLVFVAPGASSKACVGKFWDLRVVAIYCCQKMFLFFFLSPSFCFFLFSFS